MQPKLIVAQEEVKVLKAKIEEDSRQAEETRQVVIEEEAIATAKKNECEGMRNEAADELAVGMWMRVCFRSEIDSFVRLELFFSLSLSLGHENA